jgi:hypothetical protein
MTEFEANNPEQLKLFLTKLNKLVDDYHPNIYLLEDVSKGINLIVIGIVTQLNKGIKDTK